MLFLIQTFRKWLTQELDIIAYLTAENLALRHQLIVLKRNQNRVRSMGIEEVLTTHRSPWQNAYVERVNGSIRRAYTDHIIVWNTRHLKRVLKSYFDYYNNDRTHFGIEKETPIDRQVSKMTAVSDQLVEIPKVGGLHHRYEWRKAA